MNSEKTKNVLIIILVLLNLFFAAFRITDYVRKDASRRNSEKTIREILLSEEVTLDNGVNISVKAAPLVTLRRNTDTEKKQMARVMGKIAAQDLGGNIVYYNGADGEGQMRGTGEYDIMLYDYEGDSTRKGAQKIMKYLGMPDCDSVFLSNADDSYNISTIGSYKGYPVYNAKTDFIMANGRFLMITGTKVFDDELTSVTDGVMSSYDAVALLVSLIENDGYVCSRICSIEPGYTMTVPVSGECTLTPVWLIRTDTADIYINACTGELETGNLSK